MVCITVYPSGIVTVTVLLFIFPEELCMAMISAR